MFDLGLKTKLTSINFSSARGPFDQQEEEETEAPHR